MMHILDNHTLAGAGYAERVASSDKLITNFSPMMSSAAIESAVKQAYNSAEIVGSQGDRYLLQGQGGGYAIEMWFNAATKTIETAYPLP
jgi:hypothetical protein